MAKFFDEFSRLPAYGLIHEIHAGVRKWGLEIKPTL